MMVHEASVSMASFCGISSCLGIHVNYFVFVIPSAKYNYYDLHTHTKNARTAIVHVHVHVVP